MKNNINSKLLVLFTIIFIQSSCKKCDNSMVTIFKKWHCNKNFSVYTNNSNKVEVDSFIFSQNNYTEFFTSNIAKTEITDIYNGNLIKIQPKTAIDSFEVINDSVLFFYRPNGLKSLIKIKKITSTELELFQVLSSSLGKNEVSFYYNAMN